ncbi:MAG TPA: serine/threonine-protein kinase [Candidatus Sulfotelmatobacter sp.]|nr:serine/threonine-protein kinase [Candidatus Sulfotelmatobacter sp.]
MKTTAALQDIFANALDIADASERQAMLDRACADQPQLRQRVDQLLAAHEKSEDFISDCISVVAGSVGEMAPASEPGEDLIGSRIGPYKLLQKIGEGGGGAVFMAEQESPVRRRVALKILKLGMDTKNVVARFEAERQALALMDHPNIARVLDAGATKSGRPFFVMELVSGVRITEFCDADRLDTKQRLELFTKVCHAIQHAHQKGIIHRDIKPSNILVTPVDGEATPKVIDFGIAKALEEKLTDKTLFTLHGQFIGTPAYMSPEQAQLSSMDVDTRSDIYSLGVLLYELLTGKTPFDQGELLAAGLEEMRRKLREQEPPRPSTKIDTLGEAELTATAQRRHMEVPRLRSELRGDLDWVVMKALEKDRRRRYETADALAQDVQNYLANEPVSARPPSRAYLAQKFVRRNKTVFFACLLTFLALAASTVMSSWMYLREREARRMAVAAEQKQLTLQHETLQLESLAEEREKFMSAEEMYENGRRDDADALLEQVKQFQPGSDHATLYRELGDWHAVNGRWSQALERFAVLFQINNNGQKDTSLDDERCGALLVDQGRLNDYEQFRRDLVARNTGADNVQSAQRLIHYCLLVPADKAWLQNLDEAAALLRNSLQDEAGISRGNWENSAFALALLAYRSGHFAEAADWSSQALARSEGSQPREANIRILRAMSSFQNGDKEGAISELDACRKVVDDHPATPNDPAHLRQTDWYLWLTTKIHLREAENLIKK